MAQVTYLAQIMETNKEIEKKIESIIYKFIWNNKKDKIKRTTMIGDYIDGGLKMIDVQSFFFIIKI